MADLVPIRRALLSVSDKTDLVPFAKALTARGVSIISTGGTASVLCDAGIEVVRIEEMTGFPEGLDGRVKTLHPNVHAALLAVRDDEQHVAFLEQHKIEPIDMVCINLYPFERTVSNPNVRLIDAIENVDIGGPAMLRAAAKNHEWVTVVTSPRWYDKVVTEMDTNNNSTTRMLRSDLAASAYARTAEYDAAIASFLSRRTGSAFSQVLSLRYTRVDELRYGENPHQQAALYRDPSSTGPTIVNAEQIHGRPLSYNNINDSSAALDVVKELGRLDGDQVGAVVIKHATPCGMAMGPTASIATDRALAGDPTAAYGGILALNRPLDAKTAEEICQRAFLEVIVAPSFDAPAAELLQNRWRNIRLLAVGEKAGSIARKLEYRSIPGGMLVQDRDARRSYTDQWVHSAGPAPTGDQLRAAAIIETACKHVKSNAIVIGGTDGESVRVFGVGGGQVDRVGACRIAIGKAGDLAEGAIASSDAFFPFPDGPTLLADAGVRMIVHPGGSKRDDETFSLCESRGITCVTTGTRHFKH